MFDNFKRIFLREAEKVEKDIIDGESILKKAEQRIIELKNTNKSKLLKIEVINLITELMRECETIGSRQANEYSFIFINILNEDKIKINDKYKKIKQIIDELIELKGE